MKIKKRCLYSPQVSKLYLNEFPKLRITADFSHWCCVSESLLYGNKEEIVETKKRAMSIHARLDYSQGPQVNHAFTPENKEALEKYLEW